MKVRIKRQDDRRSAPYWQVFHFRGEGRITVAAILEKLNERDQLEDIKGKQCRKIRWECGCMQKMCGSCAMVTVRITVGRLLWVIGSNLAKEQDRLWVRTSYGLV